jgi:carbamoyl-phosphate synthase small subunit
MEKSLYLVLENGKIFKGYSIGADGDVTGEVVFQTSVLGYNETITDPRYYGQIVVDTFPLVGNYGIIKEEIGSKKPVIAGFVVKSICDAPSNFRCEGNLEDYMKENGIVGLAGIDTRELTRIIRENGTLAGKITKDIDNIDSIIKELKSYKEEISYKDVSIDNIKEIKAENAKGSVCIYDLGMTDSFKELFLTNGFDVTVVPYDTKAEDAINIGADAVVISEGPGNPENCKNVSEEIKKLIDKDIAVYGCGLGHQLVALAMGAKIKKHSYGHRGANQPVKDTKTDKIYITSQNHGYIVDDSTLPKNAKISFVNVNDKTIEGLEFDGKKIITTQFMPNNCKGPHNTEFIIDSLFSIMKGEN